MISVGFLWSLIDELALVNNELTETVITSILVGLADDPSWSITDPEVQDLVLIGHGVEALHQLRDRGGEVPPAAVLAIALVYPPQCDSPVNVEQVDVIRA